MIKSVVDGCIVDDNEISKIMTYLICAREFHFTPQEVDNIDRSLLEGMIVGLSRIKEREAEANKK